MKKNIRLLPVIALFAMATHAQHYSWQRQHAKVLPTGGLEWAPEPFAFQRGAEVRHIDFENGNDARDGRTRATAWKHHPLDPAFRGNATPADTYIFRRGVTYRGSLLGRIEGTAQRPIILTSDPGWGTGEAVIAGSELVTGWRRGADNPAIPDAAAPSATPTANPSGML